MPGMGRGGPAGFPGGPGSPDAGGRAGAVGGDRRPQSAWRLHPRSRDGAHERQSQGRRAEFLLPDARYSESVRIRRQRVPFDRRQASDAHDDGAERARMRSLDRAGEREKGVEIAVPPLTSGKSTPGATCAASACARAGRKGAAWRRPVPAARNARRSDRPRESGNRCRDARPPVPEIFR